MLPFMMVTVPLAKRPPRPWLTISKCTWPNVPKRSKRWRITNKSTVFSKQRSSSPRKSWKAQESTSPRVVLAQFPSSSRARNATLPTSVTRELSSIVNSQPRILISIRISRSNFLGTTNRPDLRRSYASEREEEKSRDRWMKKSNPWGLIESGRMKRDLESLCREVSVILLQNELVWFQNLKSRISLLLNKTNSSLSPRMVFGMSATLLICQASNFKLNVQIKILI